MTSRLVARFNVPPAANTQAFGINKAGEVVGTGGRGACRLTAGNFTTGLNVRDSLDGDHQTILYDINTAGGIVGSFFAPGPKHLPGGPQHIGFLLSGGNFTTFGGPPGLPIVSVTGINDAGQIVGSLFEPTGGHGFIRTGANFETIDVPHARVTQILGVNNVGQVVGTYVSPGGVAFRFLQTGGNFITFNAVPEDINDLGEIVGYGFAFSPTGDAQGFVTTFAGSSPTDPILPNSIQNGVFGFQFPLGGNWYDPPFASGFTYSLTGGETFNEVGTPPASLGFGPVNVVVGGSILDTLAPGEHFLFTPGITTFTLQGISPLVDAADPTAFPTFLDFTGTPTSLTMAPIAAPNAVPEPGTWLLLATGCIGLLGYGWHKRCRA